MRERGMHFTCLSEIIIDEIENMVFWRKMTNLMHVGLQGKCERNNRETIYMRIFYWVKENKWLFVRMKIVNKYLFLTRIFQFDFLGLVGFQQTFHTLGEIPT